MLSVRRLAVLAAGAALLNALLASCGDNRSSSGNDAPAVESVAVSAASPGPAAANPSTARKFTSVERLQTTAASIRERVTYRSADLLITGLVCRPVEPGRFPILMYQHGGFSGVGSDADGEGLCQYMADRGYVVMMSSYRGADGSDGRTEYCAGEVSDVIEMLGIAQAQPYSAAGEIALLGLSHGGCISLQMIAQGVPAQVIVDVFGPSDWASLFVYAEERVASGVADADNTQFITDALTLIGSPASNPAAYQARSPIAAIAALERYAGAMLIVHGGQDTTVPPIQSCSIARGLSGFQYSHLGIGYIPGLAERTSTAHPSNCGAPDLPWAPGDHPGKNNWAGLRHFTYYDAMSHLGGIQLPYAIDDAENFIRTKLPGGRRSP